jgi:hypothetical protein
VVPYWLVPGMPVGPGRPRRMTTLRTPGSRWRLLVHERFPRRQPDGLLYGTAHSIGSSRELAGDDGPHRKAQVLEGTEFDELVVGGWLHIEQQDATTWWMDVAGIMICVRADRDGKPVSVLVEPGEEHPGCTYRWETGEVA